MVFLNGSTGEIDAIAHRPQWMSTSRYATIKSACQNGKAYDVVDDLIRMIKEGGYHDCFLVFDYFD